MCYRLFVASNQDLPLVPWNDDAPAFNASELPRAVANVRDRFSLPNVVEVGAHTGCACGFVAEVEEKPEDRAEREPALQGLVAYLCRINTAGAQLEVYLCWEGGEFETARTKALLCKDFLEPLFPLQQQELARIVV